MRYPSAILWYFNPHSHEGSDFGRADDNMEMEISIHTPTKGVTNLKLGYGGTQAISIHTPTKGVTGAASGIVNAIVFQSTLPRRE